MSGAKDSSSWVSSCSSGLILLHVKVGYDVKHLEVLLHLQGEGRGFGIHDKLVGDLGRETQLITGPRRSCLSGRTQIWEYKFGRRQIGCSSFLQNKQKLQ